MTEMRRYSATAYQPLYKGQASSEKTPSGNAWCFFAPSDFPPPPRAGIWKNRVAKNRVLTREGSPIFTSDFFYQRFFR